jgi:hypothetical protein
VLGGSALIAAGAAFLALTNSAAPNAFSVVAGTTAVVWGGSLLMRAVEGGAQA